MSIAVVAGNAVNAGFDALQGVIAHVDKLRDHRRCNCCEVHEPVKRCIILKSSACGEFGRNLLKGAERVTCG